MKTKRLIIALLTGMLFTCNVFAQAGATLPRLSPLPKQVDGVSTPVISLNDSWTFHTSSISQASITVPGEWTMQGFDVPEGETAYYNRSFDLPSDWAGKRIMIRFDGVSSYGKVLVNNKFAGEHEGGMVPFEVDITEAVRPGKNNLTVEVRAWTISDRLGCISQYAVHTVGGLVRKVRMYALPQANIASMDVVTELDKSFRHATLTINTGIDAGTISPDRITVNYELKDATGKKVAGAQQKPAPEGNLTAALNVRNAKLWNSEEPNLYTLTTSLLVDGKLQQSNEQRIGLRQVKVEGNILYVNGKPVKLRGVNRHEVHPLLGRSLTPELCRQDAMLFKAGNCNYIRTSHYPPFRRVSRCLR